VQDSLTLGEYVRRLRRQAGKSLQEIADMSGLSMSSLSRIENDNAVPNADAVVKLSHALGGDLDLMLVKADCLPEEILERLQRRVAQGTVAFRRAAGDGADAGFAQALVDDMDPPLRDAIAEQFQVSRDDADSLYEALRQLSLMEPEVRAGLMAAMAAFARGASD
jgi:transcriptional regulator with XRE-family HTH domain